MDIVNGLAASTDIFVEIDSNTALGAPDDPTSLAIQITYSATRRLGGTPTWQDALWQSDPFATPTKRWAKGTVELGQLTEGVWYPFVKISTGDAEPIVPGAPFRVQGGPAAGPVDSDSTDSDSPGAPGSTDVAHRRVFVSTDEFATLFTAPVELVPGVNNKLIVVDELVIQYGSEGGAWQVGDGGLYAFYGTTGRTPDNDALSKSFSILAFGAVSDDRMFVAAPLLPTPRIDLSVGTPLSLSTGGTGDPQALNALDDVTGIDNPGTGYQVGDLLELSNFAGDRAVIEVTAVDGSGGITAYTVTSTGSGYANQGGVATLLGGSGVNASAFYTGINPPVGHLWIDVFYRLVSVGD